MKLPFFSVEIPKKNNFNGNGAQPPAITATGHGNNAEGVAGVAWAGVRLMALKFLSASGGGRTSDAIKCLNYAPRPGFGLAW